jgi:hypothetical protein
VEPRWDAPGRAFLGVEPRGFELLFLPLPLLASLPREEGWSTISLRIVRQVAPISRAVQVLQKFSVLWAA